jgi:hypothetical protein
MTKDTADQVKCAAKDCGHVLGNYPAGMEPEGERNPCPECGGLARRVSKTLSGELVVRSNLDYAQFPPGSLTNKQRISWGMTGWELSKRRGRMIRKESHFDKRGNRRYEHIEDPATGEVLHHEDHPLTEHRGHGSDKLDTKQPGNKA